MAEDERRLLLQLGPVGSCDLGHQITVYIKSCPSFTRGMPASLWLIEKRLSIMSFVSLLTGPAAMIPCE